MLGGVTPGRRAPFLTPERVQQRFDTLLDAFQTADRRQRGYLPYDRVVAIYSLYFNASVGKLDDNELAQFADKIMAHHPSDGGLVVDYLRLADDLRKRDMDMMNKAARQGGTYAAYHSPTQGATDMPPNPNRINRVPFATHEALATTQAPAERRRQLPMGANVGYAPPPAGPLDGMGGGGGGSMYAALSHQAPPGPGIWASPKRAQAGMLPPVMEADGGGPTAAAPMMMLAPLAQGAAPVAAAGGEGGGGGSLAELLASLEAADAEQHKLLYGAQVLTCCRMFGLDESSQMLHAVLHDVTAPDGRCDYVHFVQQLAAQRAGAQFR